MAVTEKITVDVSGLKKGISEAVASVKTIDAALKKNEAQFKSTGDAEQYMAQKSEYLRQKLDKQKSIIENTSRMLADMNKRGVSQTSTEYQKLSKNLLEAEAAMIETQNALNGLDKSQEEAAGSAEQLVKSMNSMGKKISLNQVISGVNAITGGLENAAKRAVELGEQLWSTIMDSASRADDTATLAEMFGYDIETYQKMQKLVTGGMDTTVESMLAAQDKLNRGIGKGSKEVMDVLRDLNLLTVQGGKYGNIELIPEDSTALFWQAGQALMAMSEAYDKEAAATALFGKSWKELKPLFDTYGSLEEYNEARDKQIVNDEQTIRDLAALNDAVGKLESSWTTLKDEMLGAIAPALTKGAEAVGGLLDKLTEYLKTDEGQEMLTRMGTAVSGLFDDLDKIDPEQVVEGFVGVFEQVIGGFEWLMENKETVIDALKYIIEGWGLLKITGGALHVWELIQGITGFSGGASAATAAGTTAGAAWGAAFADAVAAAAPWLIGLYALLKPGETGNNDLADASGAMTAEGWSDFMIQRQRFSESGEGGRWADLIAEAGEIVDAAAMLWDDPEGIQALAQYAISGDKEKLAANLQALGYVLRVANEDLLPEMKDGGTAYTFEGDRSGREVFRRDRRTGELILPAEVVPEDDAEDVAEQVGTVILPAFIEFKGWSGNGPDIPYFGGEPGFANGLSFVPNNGLYLLHKGEQVVPAREVSSRNYSSNLYVENMNMGGGMDAEGLAARMSAAQRRMLAGYGS